MKVIWAETAYAYLIKILLIDVISKLFNKKSDDFQTKTGGAQCRLVSIIFGIKDLRLKL